MSILDSFQSGLHLTFAAFWRQYLGAHRRPATRAAHYAATALGAGATLAAIHFGQIAFMLGGIALAYAMAVGSHRFIEGNRALIRVHIVYGAIAELKMCWFAITGRLGAEYRRLGLMD